MTRKKKTPPAERREQERQRRINAPEEHEKRKAAIDEARAKAAQEKAAKPGPVIETVPDQAVTTPDAPPAAPCANSYAAHGTLKFTDAGDAGGSCRRYQVQYPARMDIQGLFNAIRAKGRDENGLVYISTNLADAGPENYQLSYEYADNLFTRREDVSRNKKSPALADLLGHPITRLQALGGYGRMDYFVNVYALDDMPDGDGANA